MKSLTVSSQCHLPINNHISTQKPSKSSILYLNALSSSSGSRLGRISARCSSLQKREQSSETKLCIAKNPSPILPKPVTAEIDNPAELAADRNGYTSMVISGAIFVGVVLLTLGMDDGKALALGPEGPLMEEFWENVRRYALYALTVSTGVLYAGLQPILELLKNPITAVLIITIITGSIYILIQVLSLMSGVADFAYEYSY